jgi:hypothetical protein
MRSEVRPWFSASNLLIRVTLLTQLWQRLSNWRRQRLGLRGTLIFLLGSPLAVAAVVALASGNLPGFAGSAGALGLLVLGARLNRRGLMERLVGPRRRFTRATWFPFQHVALALVVLGVALTASAVVGHGPLISIVFAALAATGFHLAYRLPSLPLPSGLTAVRIESIDPVVARALGQAERELLAIDGAAIQIGNAELAQRLRRIAEQGRAVLDLLAKQPANLHRARRFLNVHLDGAERVAVRYAKTHRVLRGGVLEASFRNVLVQIESAFDRQRRSLLQHELTDLDVQIEVLRKQLRHEGIA